MAENREILHGLQVARVKSLYSLQVPSDGAEKIHGTMSFYTKHICCSLHTDQYPSILVLYYKWIMPKGASLGSSTSLVQDGAHYVL